MSIRTLLIGLDGATFDVLNPLMEQGVMPFLKSFFASGVGAPLRTIIPPLTPPAWTSLMTGRSPGHHGVFDFFRRESEDNFHIRFFTSRDVQSETVWSLAAAQGCRVTVLNFPSMFPAPQLPGYVVPGWVPWRQLRLACWPTDLFEELKQLPDFNPRELAMDFKLEEKATEGAANKQDYGPWVEFHIRRERNWLRVFQYLVNKSPSDLTAVLFDGVDKLQHLCWRFISPATAGDLKQEWELEVRDLCLQYYRELDGIIQEMCRLAGPDASVILASDHGFGPTNEVFHVNAWLEEQGYLSWSDAARDWDTDGAMLGVGKVARHTWMLDWDRTRAFAPTPTSNGIFIVRNRKDSAGGVAPGKYDEFRAELIERLENFRDPATGEPVVRDVWTREEAFGGPAGALAPDLTLGLRDGGLVSILPSKDILRPRSEVAGTHRPLGIFGAQGPGVKQGVLLDELSILDIAPALLYTLGLPCPEDLEGDFPGAVFDPRKLREDAAVRSSTSSHSVDSGLVAPGDSTMTDEDEQAILDKMRDLGYLE